MMARVSGVRRSHVSNGSIAVAAGLCWLCCGCGSPAVDPSRSPLRSETAVELEEDTLRNALAELQNPESRNRVLGRKSKEEREREQLALDYVRGQRPEHSFYHDELSPNKEVLEFRNQITLNQIVDGLNQWAAGRKGAEVPPPSKLTETLPADLAADGVVFSQLSRLDRPEFDRNPSVIALNDGWFLQETVWLRDLSNRLVGGTDPGSLAAARRLFDWTVRNLDLLPGEPDETVEENGRRTVVHPPLLPWQALLYGKGQRVTRSWVFGLLARQQGLDAVYLDLPKTGATAEYEHWCVGIVAEGEIHLFEPELGIPIPGPKPNSILTLRELLAKPELLAVLDLPGEPHRFAGRDLSRVRVGVEGTWHSLSTRMERLQKELTGPNGMRIAAGADAVAAEAVKAGADRAVLWPHPFELLRRVATRMSPAIVRRLSRELDPFLYPTAELWTARIFHLKGFFVPDQAGTPGIPPALQPLDNKAAVRFYFDVRVRAAEAAKGAVGIRLNPAQARTLELIEEGREDANFWLALLAVDRGNPDLAVRSLKLDVLADKSPGPWLDAARYNLGRLHEEAGRLPEALAAYDAVKDSPWTPACKWRAAKLRSEAEKAGSATPDAAQQGAGGSP